MTFTALFYHYFFLRCSRWRCQRSAEPWCCSAVLIAHYSCPFYIRPASQVLPFLLLAVLLPLFQADPLRQPAALTRPAVAVSVLADRQPDFGPVTR